jgi:CDP-glucose 4,6-dehydratase
LHYLITGHTGFKGSWLVLLLRIRGHDVSGLALDPASGSLFERADIARELIHDIRADVRDREAVMTTLSRCSPDVVIHMAAQPLVRESLKQPRLTFETNALGTLSVLEAVSATPSVRAHVVVTTDKVYRNAGQASGYREDAPLGGSDPYSASKAMAELVTQSWVESFDPCPTATARAGNVIGGGDVSRARLLPDLLGGLQDGIAPLIRYPDAVRPWQHVLDAVNGYLVLADALLSGSVTGESWNFGPDPAGFATVREVADRVVALWGDGAAWRQDAEVHPPEARLLTLDATKAMKRLGWQPRLNLAQAIAWTVEWSRLALTEPAATVTRQQVAAFETSGA